MSVDFVARALARQQQSGQAQTFTTLATGIPGIQVPAGVKVIQTSGYASEGRGAGTYVSDSLAKYALAAVHPRFCKADAAGRYWRLLPDDNNLVPVSCGGANGFAQTSAIQETLADSTESPSAFSASPWSQNAINSGSAGAPGPDGTGTATTLTATGGSYSLVYRASNGTKLMRARVKAGTANRIYLYSNADAINTTALVGCWFDLSAGTITKDDFGTGKITPLGGGWFEIEVVAACYNALGIGLSDGENENVAVGKTGLIFDFRLYTTTEVSLLETLDDRPAIQAAIAYCEAIGAAGTRYDAANYPLRRVSRTLSAPNDVHSNKSGLLLQTTKSHRFISSCGCTTLWRRDTDGSAMGKAKFDICTGSGGYYWRGGGIFVGGQVAEPDDVSENSIYLHDMILDGGITDSSEENNPYGANMHSSGDGWDVSDKGIWQANDRYCGHIVLEGRSGIRYFMGELIYGSGAANGLSRANREIRIGPDVDIGHTCGSCINGNGQTLKVERCRLHNAYMGLECWTGHLGGYVQAVIADCNRNTLQGGTPNFGAGSFFQKTRPIPTVVPMGQVDLVLHKAGSFEIGSWISGRIEAFDCYPNLGNQAAFSSGCQEVDLHVITWADRQNVLAGVGLVGSAPGTMQTDKVSLRIDCKRTDNAVTNNYRVAQAAYTYGSFGPSVCVWVGAGLEQFGAAPVQPAAGVTDNAIKVLGWQHRSSIGGPSWNIEANDNGTLDVLNKGNVINFSCTNSGSYTTNLPTTGIPAGYRLFLANYTNNYVAGGSACRIPASNFRGGRELIIPPGYGFAELEFDGGSWSVINQPRTMAASVTYDPPSVAGGASTTTTVTLTGAVVGDAVDAGFSNSLQGMVLSAHVSAANTVTVVLFNPTGSAIDLSSGTLRVTVG